MSAWDSFWSQLWSGEWAANTGVPLVVTIGGIIAAYFLFRGQLRADREAVEAARHHNFAIEYATIARRHAFELEETKPEFFGDTDEAALGRLREKVIPICVQLTDAAGTLGGRVGTGPLVQVALTIPHVLLSQMVATLPWTARFDADADRLRQRLRLALYDHTINGIVAELRALAVRCETWDGKEQPTADSLGYQARLIGTDEGRRTHGRSAKHDLNNWVVDLVARGERGWLDPLD